MACMVVPAVASTGSIYSREIKENQISTLKDIANREKFFSCFIENKIGEVAYQAPTASVDSSAEYSYVITEDKPGAVEPYVVTMDICLKVNNSTYVTTVTGRVGEFYLEDGRTYMTGSLNGVIMVNEFDYDITVGFNKIKQEDGMSACVTMMPINSNNSEDMIAFRFGEDVMDNNILNMFSNNLSDDEEYNNTATLYGVASTKVVGSAYATLKGYSSRGISETVYADANNNRLYTNVTSYCDNMKNTDIYAYTTSVHEVDYYLTRKSGVALKSIFSSTSNDITEGEVVQGEMVLDAIQMCLEATGYVVPAKFLEMMRLASAEYYTPTCNENKAVVRLTFGVGKHTARFDDTPCSMAVNMNGNGTGTYTMTTQIEYYILNDGGFYYASSNMATSSFSATF